VTSRLLDAQDGRQYLAATVGQIYYFQPPRVILPGEILSTENRSDLVAQLAVTAFQNWSTDAAVQWNPQTQSSVRTQVNLQYKAATDSVVNLAYRYDSTVVDLHQVEISGAWPIKHNWNVFVRDVYSIPDHEEFERFAGFEYRACCWRVRLGARRYISSHIPGAPQDTGVWLQLELAGLAGVGSASDAFLTEEIRGYLPPGAALPKNQAPLKGIW
jgi:LPS-assembly protein